jgi:hypothetical protein
MLGGTVSPYIGGLDGALADRFNGPPYLRLKST